MELGGPVEDFPRCTNTTAESLRRADTFWPLYSVELTPITIWRCAISHRETPERSRDVVNDRVVVADEGCVLRFHSRIRSSFYVGPGERIVPCNDSYRFAHKCLRKYGSDPPG